MALSTHNDSTDTPETVSLSVKGILAPVSQALKDVSQARKVNQSVLLREMVNGPMSSLIHVFCLKSPLVNSLDLDVVQYLGGTLTPAWSAVPLAPQFEAVYLDLLSISNEDDLTRILLRNAQFIRMRAGQCLPKGTQITGSVSMHLALFSEIAGRDEQTIEAYWAGFARFWGQWYQRQDYYQHINQLRSAQGLEPANAPSEAGAEGVYARVQILQAEATQPGFSHVLMTLRTENTRPLPTNVFGQFALPNCNGNLLSPDPGYGIPFIYPNNSLGMGFSFKEEICSLHCYTVTDPRLGPTATLSEVATALVSAVDDTLRPYAVTFPVTK